MIPHGSTFLVDGDTATTEKKTSNLLTNGATKKTGNLPQLIRRLPVRSS